MISFGMAGVADNARRVTRGQLLDRGLVLGGGLASGAIVAGGFTALALSSPSHQQDLEVLSFALAFEQLQADFYARASRGLALRGDWLQFAQVVGAHERAHVAFLQHALGPNPRPAPRFRLTRTPGDLAAFQSAAVALEDIGVALYNGQAGNLTPARLAAAAEIVSVEARHAAWARELAGELPAPVATDVPASAADVQARLARMGVRIA
jgi:Ferritin-like domain